MHASTRLILLLVQDKSGAAVSEQPPGPSCPLLLPVHQHQTLYCHWTLRGTGEHIAVNSLTCTSTQVLNSRTLHVLILYTYLLQQWINDTLY